MAANFGNLIIEQYNVRNWWHGPVVLFKMQKLAAIATDLKAVELYYERQIYNLFFAKDRI